MARQIDHKHAFGPRALNCMAQAFEDAWQEVGAQINQKASPEQIELTRGKLAQWIINYATIGKLDAENVEELKEHALLGLRCSAELRVWRRHD